MAHRWAWSEGGRELPDDAVLMHSCDVPACVNPAHLRVGTAAENVADMVAKQRHARGEQVGGALLTTADVKAIRARYRKGAHGEDSARAIALSFGVSTDAVRKIGQKKHWRHVQ